MDGNNLELCPKCGDALASLQKKCIMKPLELLRAGHMAIGSSFR